jgi:hypothetical protein
LRAEKFRQTNNRRALLRRVANKILRAGEIFLRFRATLHLDQRDFCFLSHSRYFTESAGTMSILSIVTRSVGLLISFPLFRVTGVFPIFSSTSSPLINFPNVVY